MPDYIKNTSLKDLKTKYGENHGFIFLTHHALPDSSIESLANIIKKVDISTNLPLLVTRVEAGIVFIYEILDAPRFFQIAQHCQEMFGFDIRPSSLWLREQ